MKVSVVIPSQIPESMYDSVIGFDIETEDLPIQSRICLVSIYKPGNSEVYVVPLHVVDGNGFRDLPERELDILKEFYSRSILVGANLQFDISRILFHWGVRPKDVYIDTFLLARICQLDKQGLKEMAVRCNPDLYETCRHFDDVMGSNPPFYYDLSDSKVVKYSALDAYLPFVIINSMKQQIKANKNAVKIESKFVQVASEQNALGLNFDINRFQELFNEYKSKAESKNLELNELVGYPIKVNSVKQLRQLLIEKYNCETNITTKKGEVSTSVDSLSQMRDNDSREEVIDLIDRIIEIKKMQSVYNAAKKVPNFIIDNRLHFNIEQIGYDGTGRVYSKDFSVNQLSRTMREAVIPSSGKKFFYMDYKAAELYISLFWSHCKKGLDWYNEGKDLHSEVMKILLGKKEITKEDRNISKVLSFSQIYGGTENTIARDLNCDIEYAKQLADDYKRLFPEIVDLRNYVVNRAHEIGYTQTYLGRKRFLPDINSDNTVESEKSERRAFNTAIQSTCADLLKIAAYRCYKEFSSLGVRCAFTVFDSFLLEVPEDMTEDQLIKIADRLSDFSDIIPGFKLRYDYAVGHNWHECQENC